ncbi:MAG TPA: glycoside hydrolase family 3 C-terminal domain-containing protein [bacterium]|nr:glycoside hydrolase family 3 C-terminal domain-containing protein [bacterium]
MNQPITFRDVVCCENIEDKENLISRLVDSMTLDEKIHLMAGGEFREMLKPYGAVLFEAGGNRRLGIPPIAFTDGPRGVMLNHSTCFPVNIARGATWDTELEERVGDAMGKEAAAQGANMSGAVCINVLRHPAWGRAQETFGEDQFHIGEMGAALTRGLRKHVMPCVKHFAANSIENSRFFVDVKMTERTLREVYLPHFKKCIDNGADVVMGAYNRLNGEYCCHNSHLLTDILKDEWGFDGIVVSDFNLALRGADAADAGLDIEMPTRLFFGRLLRARVEQGKTAESAINDAAIRIVRKLAGFARKNDPDAFNEKVVVCREHTGLAREVARKSVVLLKNEHGALPLKRDNIRKLAVIGRLAKVANLGDTGSSIVSPPYAVTPLEGLKRLAGEDMEIMFSDGRRPGHARRIAREADAVVVVVGLTHEHEGEYIPVMNMVGDRSCLSLPAGQERLIRAVAEENRKCIVVVEGGSAVTMARWIDSVPAVLMAWYPGMEGGTAVAEILFGDVNPSGRLPVVFPRLSSQCVLFEKWTAAIDYDYLHGYRYMDKNGTVPMFSFGHGLSYTDFEYLSIDVKVIGSGGERVIKVVVEVENTGGVSGEEVVQLYVSYPGSGVERPVRELKGFKRIELDPGERGCVEIAVDPQELAYFDEGSGDWIIENIEYEFSAGSSSAEEDLVLSNTLSLKREKLSERMSKTE